MKKIGFILCALLVLTMGCEKGEDGFNSLVDFESFTSNKNCISGGLLVKSGLDKNRNNVLDSVEVTETSFVCNGQSGATDKQILLYIDFSGNTTSSTPTHTTNAHTGLIKFNKQNYPGVDSIIMVANPYVEFTTNTANVELYNVTDDVSIQNSRITTNNQFNSRSFLQTNNLYHHLPDKEVQLGIKYWSGVDGQFAGTGSAFLILYRK